MCVCVQVDSGASIGSQSDLLFLKAMLAQKTEKPITEVIQLLNQTIDAHFTLVKVLLNMLSEEVVSTFIDRYA